MLSEEYRKNEGISNSELKEFKKSPLHYWHYKNSEPEHKPQFDFGNAFHTYILEPEKFDYTVWSEEDRPELEKGMTSNKNKEWKASLRNPLHYNDFEKIRIMKENLETNEFAKDLIDSASAFEEEIFWDENGVKLKGKPDIIGFNYIADLKTMDKVDYKSMKKAIFMYDYYRQAAMYLSGTGKDEFYIIACEKNPPHDCVVYQIGQDIIQIGDQEYTDLAERLQWCIMNDEWPGMQGNEIEKITYDL